MIRNACPTLLQLTEGVYLPSRLGMRANSAAQLVLVARHFDAFSHSLPVSEITDELETAWLQSLVKSGLSPSTVNTRRRSLNTLRTFAYKKHFSDEPPRDVPRMREPARVPEAWTVEEVASLLQATGRLPGRLGNCSASSWWTALVSLCYWSGARIGDVMASRSDSLDLDRGTWTCTASKTGKQHRYQLHPTCVASLARIHNAGRQLLFAWPYSPGHLFVVFRGIVKASGIRYDGGRRMLFHRLRRTHASYCWASDPALAVAQMDHSSARVTQTHYVDPSIGTSVSAADVLPIPIVTTDRQRRLF